MGNWSSGDMMRMIILLLLLLLVAACDGETKYLKERTFSTHTHTHSYRAISKQIMVSILNGQ